MKFEGFDIDFSLKEKVALVTGGYEGIGRAISALMAQKGCAVIMVDINPGVVEVVEDLRKSGLKAKGIVGNVLEDDRLQSYVDVAVEAFGRLDIMVNNAAIGVTRPLKSAEDFDVETFDRMYEINLRAPFLLSQLAARQMKKQGQGGRIINLSSQAGIVAIEGHIGYTTSKAALIGMTKVFALELGKYGITTNAICPTAVMTNQAKQYWVGETYDKGILEIPTGRFAEPEEIAGLVAYLASDASSMINGASLVIDGGYTIH